MYFILYAKRIHSVISGAGFDTSKLSRSNNQPQSKTVRLFAINSNLQPLRLNYLLEDVYYFFIECLDGRVLRNNYLSHQLLIRKLCEIASFETS
jgi:hypothetical protein